LKDNLKTAAKRPLLQKRKDIAFQVKLRG